MNANANLERRLADYYVTEAQQRAPERVLASVLDTTEATRQRRVFIRVPWRVPTMNTYTKVAIAAVLVIGVGALGLSVLSPPGPSGPGGQPTASPSRSPSPIPSASPSASPVTPPALTETFTSERHGITISYPTGWTTRPATEPWTTSIPDFGSTAGDVIHDPVLQDHLWIAVASQPIGDSTPDEWVAEKLTLFECTVTEPFVVDGAAGLIGGDACNVAAVTTGGRGYVVWLYTSGDEAWLSVTYDRSWFEEVLATVQLEPEDAVDVAPSVSP